MNIRREEVEQMALLARLNIGETEKDLFSQQLSHILTFMEQLRDIDTEGIPQTATTSVHSNVWRDDELLPCLDVEQAMANAPQTDGGFFVVPKIIADRES